MSDDDFDHSVHLNQKGVFLENGEVLAWNIDDEAAPHHDDILTDVLKDRYQALARLSFIRGTATGKTYAHIGVDAPVTSSAVGDLIRVFSGLHDDTTLVIEALPGLFEGTQAQWKALKKRYPAPDPDDYDDGDADTEYHDDIKQWAHDIANDTHITVTEFLRKGLLKGADKWRERDDEWRGNPKRRKRK